MRSCSYVALMCLLMAGPLWATTVPEVQCIVQMGDGTPVAWLAKNGSDNADGTFSYLGSRTQVDEWTMDWDLTVKPDPFISSVIGLRNNAAIAQTFTFTVLLPVAPTMASPTLSGGSTTAGLTDANGDGSATLAALLGGSMYLGMIDGAGVLPLLPPSTPSLVVNTVGGSISTSENAMPELLATGAVNSTIAIQHQFTLSPGDIASFTSFFSVIPEPASIVLLAAGASLLTRRRSRR